MTRVALIGAGYIARVHADALLALGHGVAAVVDPVEGAAARLTRAVGGVPYTSLDAALEKGGFDRAHVLVPPDSHESVAATLLAAGIHTLVEKPLAVSAEACARLTALAASSGAMLGVNQNFVHHPAFVALRAQLESGAYGRPRFASCVYHAPLRQLAGRQFGHWMFRQPGNILLEQAVHPLSQVFALAGPAGAIETQPGTVLDIAPGVAFVKELTATLACREFPVQYRQLTGADFPFWRLEIACDDGILTADMLNNRFYAHGRTELLEAVDQAVSGLRTGMALAGASVGNLLRYGLSQAKLGPRADSFFVSMKGSIAAFHKAVDAKRAPELDGAFGGALVAACETMAGAFPAARLAAPVVRSERTADVVLLGGSGFIGAYTVQALTRAGLAVDVVARSLRNLPAAFDHPDVRLVRGDIRDTEQVRAAIGSTPLVVNLAHGGGGANYAEIERAMVGGAESVARACMPNGVARARLIHIGSIASLYLGKAGEVITGATPPDPKPELRGDYAHAKAVADRRLLAMHRDEGLRLVLLRPGVVVGEGTSPFHSGVGLFNNEQHCIGWNAGRNPLPFVLAADVAAAIALALTAEGIEGKAYNLAGDVRPNARDYIAMLAQALRRPLRFHAQSPELLWVEDMGKWLIKRAAGRDVAKPDVRDFRSRGMVAQLDCADVKRDLGWRPVADAGVFERDAVLVHAG